VLAHPSFHFHAHFQDMALIVAVMTRVTKPRTNARIRPRKRVER
jgi:hypothetical protein